VQQLSVFDFVHRKSGVIRPSYLPANTTSARRCQSGGGHCGVAMAQALENQSMQRRPRANQ
jgi:hypothetical protein